jgi:hypothetical protein
VLADRVVNRGPHALYRAGAAERVLRDLGVSTSGGPPALDAGRLLEADGTTAPLPTGARKLLSTRLVGLRGKAALAKLLGALPKLDAMTLGTTSIAEWLDDVPDDARRLALTLIRTATYTNAPEVVSADVAVTMLQSPGVVYLTNGWQSLVDQLAFGLHIDERPVTAVGEETVVAADGDELHARHVIMAVGTPAATFRLLGRPMPQLGPAIEAACLDRAVSHPPRIPLLLALDQPLYGSLHPGDVVHAARYLTPFEAHDADMCRSQLEAHLATMGADGVAQDRYLHRMTVVGATATAALGGLRERPSTTCSGVGRVLVVGDWIGPEGHLADAVFASAERAAHAVCAELCAA